MRHVMLSLYVLLLTNFSACAQTKTYNGEVYDEIKPYSQDRLDIFMVMKGGKWGYIDAKNKKITETIYDEVYPFKEGWALVCLNKKYGFINYEGKIIIPIEYDDADKHYNSSMALLKKGTKGAFYRKNKGFITEFKFDRSNIARDDIYYKTYQNGQSGFIDSLGNEVIKAKYEEAIALNYPNNAFLVNTNNFWTIIDKNEKPIFKSKYELLYPMYVNGLCVAKINGFYGAIDKQEKTVIPFEYEALDVTGEELFIAKKNGKYGYINKNNKIAIPFIYEFARNFKNGLADVEQKPTFHSLIDRSNETIIPANCRSIEQLDSSVFLTISYSEKKQGHNEYIIYQGNKVSYRTHNRLIYISTYKDQILFAEQKENSATIIDVYGNIVVTDNFKLALQFYLPSNYIAFKRKENGLVGVYDLKAKKVELEPQFIAAEIWEGNICLVKNDKGYYVLRIN